MDNTYHWDKLGYATSVDGEEWTNHGPVLSRGAGDDWDNTSIHHPVVLKHDKYYLYYSGSDSAKPNYNVKHIGLATSLDGENWIKELSNPILRTSDDWDSVYLRPSCPVLIGSMWVMFYWGFNGLIHSMGVAVSTDLIHWQKTGKLLSGTDSHNGVTASQVIGNRIYYTTWDNAQLNYMEYE